MKLKLNLLKKLFSVTLTTIFLIGFNVIPANAFNLANGNYDCYTGAPTLSPTNFFIIESDSAIDGSRCVDDVVIPEGVTSIDSYTFSEVGITSVTFPNSLEIIGNGAFDYNNLTSVIIPDSVIDIGSGAFAMNPFLTSVTLGNSVTSLGSYAFAGNTALTSLTIPDSVETLGEGVFQDCSALASVIIGNGLTSIAEYTFYGTSLESVTIPNSVIVIYDSSFQSIPTLTSVTIGNSVSELGSSFSNNPNLASVTFLGNAPSLVNESAFYGARPSATANVAYNATGFDLDGEGLWNGLVVVYGNPPSNDSGSSTPAVITPVVEEAPDALFNSKTGKSLSKRELKTMLDKNKTFKNYPVDKYKYSIFGTSKKTCAIKGNFVVALKDTGACEMWVTRTTAKGKNYKYWVKINYIQ